MANAFWENGCSNADRSMIFYTPDDYKEEQAFEAVAMFTLAAWLEIVGTVHDEKEDIDND